jgi:peptidoglycan/LPS O-acetylase OafA/YrhL
MISRSDNLKSHATSTGYRRDIDGLRAIAILAVILFHAFPKGLRGGFVGVDVFFVISGYLIAGIIDREIREERFTLSHFYARRARRIFPALMAVLISVVAAGALILLPGEFRQLGLHVAGGVGFIENIVLYRESGYFDTASELKPLLHLWSLAVEEQFYFFFPLLLLLLKGSSKRRGKCLAFLALISFGVGVVTLRTNSASAFFLAHNRVWELMIGALVAHYSSPLNPLPKGKREWLSYLGFFSLVLGLVLIRREEAFPGFWAILPVLGTALLIHAGTSAWINRVILSSRPMVALGLISYPLYLWHWPLLAYARVLKPELPASYRWALLAMSVILASLTALWIEKPIRFGRYRKASVKWLWIMMLACGGLGLWVYGANGFPQRFTDPRQQGAGLVVNYKAENQACQGALAKLSPCRDEGANPVLGLVGDSHAGHLLPGFRAANVPVRVLARHSCPPFAGIGFGREGSECPLGLMDAAIEAISGDPRIRTVILAGRFSVYWSGKIPVAVNRPGTVGLRIPLIGSQANESNADLFRGAAETTARELVKRGKKVVFLLDVPEMGFDPIRCLRGLPHQGIATSRCGVSREYYEADRREYREFLIGLSRRIPGISILDPAPILCDASFCSAMNETDLLYSDDDHLSDAGSRLLIPLWRAIDGENRAPR